MFWHSTKTHKPANSGTYIVYQESTGYTMVADVEHFNDGSFQFVTDHQSNYLDGISHFAEIPPIPLPIPTDLEKFVDSKVSEKHKTCLTDQFDNGYFWAMKDVQQIINAPFKNKSSIEQV